jgi:hypothetical protein
MKIPKHLQQFTPQERSPSIHWIRGWVVPRSSLDDLEKRQILPPLGLEIRPFSHPAVASCYTNGTTSCPGSSGASILTIFCQCWPSRSLNNCSEASLCIMCGLTIIPSCSYCIKQLCYAVYWSGMWELQIRKSVYAVINEIRQTESLLNKKAESKWRVCIEEKLREISDRLELSPLKSPRCLMQERGGGSKFKFPRLFCFR